MTRLRNDNASSIKRFVPWLHFGSTLPLLLILSLSAAVNSELGHQIAPGESPGFAWVRNHIGLGLGLILIARLLVTVVQMAVIRRSTTGTGPARWIGAGAELLGIAAVVGGTAIESGIFLPIVSTLYLLVVLSQGTESLLCNNFRHDIRIAAAGWRLTKPTPWYYGSLFLLGGLIAVLDPSRLRMTDQIILDSTAQRLMHLALPVWIGGVVTMWVGIGLAIGLYLLLALKRLVPDRSVGGGLLLASVFACIPGLFSILLLTALMQAVTWQAGALNLKSAGVQIFLVCSVAGSSVLATVHVRLTKRWPQLREADPLTVLCLALGATMIWPLTEVAISEKIQAAGYRYFAWLILSTCLGGIALVLFGDLFDPWFTVFSYLKNGLILLFCIVAAGTLALIIEARGASTAKPPSRGARTCLLLSLAALAGMGPFRMLDAYPEVKAVLLQYHELVRVDTSVVRVVVNAAGIGGWFHLGQDPPPNGVPDPWPPPWRLHKTRSSLLPTEFNLLVIVVDALRGDAFSSSGYPRDTTPFLDRWALSEAISFRSAYSQGGGSFAAIPFLVGGRNPFELYGPSLYQRNLYLQLARAEKIDQLWVTGRFGPRAIFPPDYPVKMLEFDRPVSDRHTPTADEAFHALGRAIDAQPPGERFLCFMHLMDVHNDLWKKAQGSDFGDRPRDVYDNNLSYLDGAFERFVGWLKSRGLYERTVVMFTADHGEQFWEHGASLHGHTLYEEEIRVPLILLTHGMVKRIDDVPVLNSDMAPTIVDLAGYVVDPAYTDPHMGISLRSLILNDEKQPYKQRTVAGRASFARRFFWYRNWQWKLVYSADLDVLQLFDVVLDPHERHNRIEEAPLLAAEMESELLAYLKRVQGRTYLPVISSRDR